MFLFLGDPVGLEAATSFSLAISALGACTW